MKQIQTSSPVKKLSKSDRKELLRTGKLESGQHTIQVVDGNYVISRRLVR